jgi:UPF0716 family protein affecting phage T7 exclusion
LLVVAGGLAATCYAFASCRFVVVTFRSRWGDLDQTLSVVNQAGGNEYFDYKRAAGLFQWLNPTSTGDNFDQGSCVGYTQLALKSLSEPYWEAIRVMAVIAVLMSFMVLVWIFLLTTLSMGRCRVVLMQITFFLLTAFTGLTFLVFQSSLCNDVGEDTSCKLDEGGLVAIAAAILWFVGLLIACCFVRPPGQDLVLVDGELRSVFADRQSERKRQADMKRTQRELQAEEKRMERERRQQEKEEQLALQRSESLRKKQMEKGTPEKEDCQYAEITPTTQVGSPEDYYGDDGGTEVYLTRALDNIERIAGRDGRV